MGWGRMLLLGNWGQQMDIEDQKREIEELRQQISTGGGTSDATAETRLARLEQENGELKLYLAALIRYLGHHGLLQQDEFRSIIETVDGEDGRTDGGYSGSIIKA